MGPQVILLAGPNGAGKSTLAPALLRDTFQLLEYVNADTIARGLAAFRPEDVAFQAGRIMLKRLDELAARRTTFAFEGTLASRSLAPWIRGLLEQGYRFHLFFVWLRSPDLAVQRVGERVLNGGHGVPEDVVRRRYRRGARNLIEVYQPLCTTWAVYDNSESATLPVLVAVGGCGVEPVIHQPESWYCLSEAAK